MAAEAHNIPYFIPIQKRPAAVRQHCERALPSQPNREATMTDLKDGISQEIWKPIPGYEGLYEVSNHGRVQSLERRVPHGRNGSQRIRGRILRLQKHKGGYQAVQLWRDNTMRRPLVHTVVAAAFIGPAPDDHDVNHIDGVKTNNGSDNLEYLTRSQNNSHAYATDLKASGERHRWSKLTADQVLEIRRLKKEQGLGCRRLARGFGVTKNTITLILNGTNWKHL
jgi:hypothetical protein